MPTVNGKPAPRVFNSMAQYAAFKFSERGQEMPKDWGQVIDASATAAQDHSSHPGPSSYGGRPIHLTGRISPG